MFTSSTFGAEWLLTTGDFHTRAVSLKGLSADGVNVGDETIPLTKFVSMRRDGDVGKPPVPKFTLRLVGGDLLTGEPDHISGEDLIWKSATIGEYSVPLRKLVSLDRGTSSETISEAPKQDAVSLNNGDAVNGVVSECSADKITVQTDGGTNDVPMTSVKRIIFASTGANAITAEHGYRIRFSDGSIISTTDAVLSDDKISLTLSGKPAAKIDVPVNSIVGIEQINGPVSWLSSRVPVENVQIPYFGGSPVFLAMMDATVDGHPLMAGDRVVERGIGVHSYSRIVFAIEPGWSVFRTQYAVDPSWRLADVTVRIKLDDKLVFEKPHVRASESADDISLDLNGAKTIALEVDYGDGGDTQDHFNWIEPALLREKPVAATLPATEPVR